MVAWVFWWSIWVSLFCFPLSFFAEVLECGGDERAALLEFKRQVNNSLYWQGDLCSWEGVECGDGSNRVTKLKLQQKGLKGVVSRSLGCLQNLKELNLSFNLLSGDAPPELFRLQHMEILDLSFNNFSGSITIPASEGLANIRTLNISSNFFRGELPNFGTASNLIAFNVSNNSFTGPIPTNVCKNSSSVQILDFSMNKFTGPLNEGLGSCEALVEFNAGSNHLHGLLPNDIYSVSSLRRLLLPSNDFSGLVVERVGNLSNIAILSLENNKFLGELPKELDKLEKLEELILANNKFNGSLPALSSCHKLQVLNLKNNSFIGNIGLNFTNFPDLVSLDLASNQLYGTIPTSLSDCKSIKTLSLAKNKLQGEIPQGLGSLQVLSFISLSNNSLVNISTALLVLQGCPNLTTLILSKNFHGGRLSSFGIDGFQKLRILALGNCGLRGQVPSWLQNCKSLQVLDLSWNSFTGSLPPWLGNFEFLFYLDMSNNSLSGEIPVNLTQLKSLTSLKNLTAADRTSLDLPLFIKHNQNASGLQYNQVSSFPPALYLGRNRLNGSIWPQFGGMKYLHILDLSRNSLTGYIPDTLSNMTNLENLDLSDNNLTGIIPSSLKALTFLAKFNVADNHLTGQIPSGGQFFSFPISSFEGNSGLCGWPLNSCNNKTLRLPNVQNSPVRSRLKRNTILGITIGVAVGIAILLSAIICSLSRRRIEIQEFENDEEFGMPERVSETVGSSLVILFKNQHNKELTVADLLKATNNFDQANIIGCGGFGLVYRATLADDTKVAIKKLTGDCLQIEREFTAEVEALSRAQHKNLVSLQGYCLYGNDRLLIYSYLENGSLDYWLHERPDGGTVLDWGNRLKIALGAGRGLAYLHRVCEPHIVHRDIKSSNILLNDKFEAHLADFGLSRLILPYDTHVTTELVGTLGYIPPEYGQTWIATLRGDVYSFGVVILELLTGKRPVDVCKPKVCRELVTWVKQMRSDGREEEIFDPILCGKGNEAQMLLVLNVACICTDQNPLKRPTIQEVVLWLENVGIHSQQLK
ncbi:hypothetical protein SUGI_0834640 [Cryptomeria japonica]|nr:hypothetical protein SUGI_0834640 [Cryptomeria japonica]